MGSERGIHLLDLEHTVRGNRVDTGFRGAARSDYWYEPPDIWDVGHGLAGQPKTMEIANYRRCVAVSIDFASVCFGAQYSFLGLRYGGVGQVMAFHDIRTLFRCGCGALRGLCGSIRANNPKVYIRLAELYTT